MIDVGCECFAVLLILGPFHFIMFIQGVMEVTRKPDIAVAPPDAPQAEQ
jgi:hypothetical protein